jgi:hypothetical protein
MSAAIPCPVCAGPIGVHVVRPEFTCHHCSWALRANVGSAFQRAIVGGVAVALVTLGAALLLPFPTDSLFEGWLRGGVPLGSLVGACVYRASLVLTPLRPQRTQTRQSGQSSKSSTP